VTFLGDDPERDLTTQRVPAGRRTALVIGAIAVVVIGTLAWKPWEEGAPASQSPPSPAFAADVPSAPPTPLNLAVPPPASPLEPTVPVSGATASPGPTPTPEVGPHFVPAPQNLGSVSFVSNEGPPAWCIYRSPAGRARRSLSIIVVEPPIILIDPGAMTQLHGVRWHVDLETNAQDKLFEAEWRVLRESSADAINAHQFGFTKPLSVRVPKGDSIAIYRAPIVVDWLGQGDELLATQRVVPGDYGALGGADLVPQSAGCPAKI